MKEIEFKIKGLMMDPLTNSPIVVLQDTTSDTLLPIWVGIFEANAIALQIEKVDTPRPMTHDLMKGLLHHLNAQVTKEVLYERIPAVRRDLSAEFDEGLTHDEILGGLRQEAPAIVRDIALFDLFRGAALGKGKKSLAFRVLLQDTRRTLTDAEIESAVSQLRQVLQQQFNAKLR